MKTRILVSICVLLCTQSLWAQAQCAKVSKVVTFQFAVNTPIPALNLEMPFNVDFFHTDLEVSFGTNGWQIGVSHDCPDCGKGGLNLLPEEALLIANPDTEWLLPSIPADFSFIGAQANEPFWILPQNVIGGGLALGVAAEFVDGGGLCEWNPKHAQVDVKDRWIQMQLIDVKGPENGEFSMWQTDGMSPPSVFLSTYNDGIGPEDIYFMSAGGHVHMNWGFTQAGLYAITFRVSTVVRRDPLLTADWAPVGDGDIYYGDGKVDFQDLQHIMKYWQQIPSLDDPNTHMFYNPDDPLDPINENDMELLSEQWGQCGYPGCSPCNEK